MVRASPIMASKSVAVNGTNTKAKAAAAAYVPAAKRLNHSSAAAAADVPAANGTNTKAKAENNPKAKANHLKVKAPTMSGKMGRLRKLPPVTVTRQWLAAHVQMFRELDWCTRHQLFYRLQKLLPVHCSELAELLCPDELLTGTNTCIPYRFKAAIRMKDKVPRNRGQPKITDFFVKVQGTHPT